MAGWTRFFTLEELDDDNRDSAAGLLGIRFTGAGENWLEVEMPVDERTTGSEGVLHLGALGVLAETVGSVAANLCVQSSRRCVGQAINVAHLLPVSVGPIRAKAVAVAILERSHVWSIEVTDASRVTVAVASLIVAVLG
jgi:1,4-dihydroxy-2-naphthoyl-CoA hydrolase